MDRLADEIEHAAAALAAVQRSMPDLAATPAAFGADDAGRPGRVGRLLHARWAGALAARAGEAAVAVERLAGVAQSIRATSADYHASDEAARHRLQREI